MKHPLENPLPGLFSFGTPCLRWKIIGAVKSQHGFPGFLAPYTSRYLSMTVTYTRDNRSLGPDFKNDVEVGTQVFTIDRITGGNFPETDANLGAPYLPFPYGEGLPGSDPGSTWSIAETSYTRVTVLQPFGQIITVQVQLSDPYTLGMLEGDLDAMIATFDPNTVDWFTFVHTDGGLAVFGDPTVLLPQQYMYGSIFGPSPLPIPTLGAAAWSALSLGIVGGGNWVPNIYAKAVGHFGMAGNYCQKTFVLDDHIQGDVTSTCISGHASCGGEFLVTPPPVSDTTIAYVLVTPNCVCGS
jgi:hypothetical protein